MPLCGKPGDLAPMRNNTFAMGKVIIFSAPSGSGKTTIVRQLLERYPQLEFSISATSRAPRAGADEAVVCVVEHDICAQSGRRFTREPVTERCAAKWNASGPRAT